MDRPSIPAPPTELKTTETLTPITTGDLSDYAQRNAEAAGAVARLNTRINGWRTWAYCVTQIVATGSAPDACK